MESTGKIVITFCGGSSEFSVEGCSNDQIALAISSLQSLLEGQNDN